jgi:hypothetical protein
MTKGPNPNQIPMTNSQIPKEEGQLIAGHLFGIWSLGFGI